MSTQSIDTVLVEGAINQIKKANSDISDKFYQLQKKISNLDMNWNCSSGSKACTKMYGFSSDSQSREAVLQNYVNILEQQVNPGYTNTETVNTKLADKFK